MYNTPLLSGECFYWAPAILDLIEKASDSIPDHWTFLPEAILTPCGFSWLGRPVNVPIMHEEISPLRALTWVPGVEEVRDGYDFGMNIIEPPYNKSPFDLQKGDLAVVFFLELGGKLPAPVFSYNVRIGQTLGDVYKDLGIVSTENLSTIRTIKFLAAMFAFIEQKILIVSRKQAVRSTRKRVDSLGYNNMINVITLRQAARQQSSDETQEDVEWSCRWIVRGHWRDQWYPSIKRNQPIWIAPYIKGPEDKPLREPQRLFKVIR
jgi:hypothetical protein